VPVTDTLAEPVVPLKLATALATSIAPVASLF
jgi:hypothetical protein